MGQACSTNNELGPEQSTVPHFKIVFIGPVKSGKSCLIDRYIHNRFNSNYSKTDRAQIFKLTKGINLPGYGLVSITLWDCPGEEDIDLRSTYYRDTDAVIVTADLSTPGSLETASQWKDGFFQIGTETVHHYLKVQGVWVDSPEWRPISDILPVVILGTKYDLIRESDHHSVLRTLDKFSESHGFKAGIPVTSRWNDGSVLRAIQTVIRLLLHRRECGDQDADDVKVETALAGPGDTEAGLRTKGGPPDYGLFSTTGIDKIDELFARANPCYARLLEWQYHFTREIRKLRQYCSQVGIIEEGGDDKESWDNVLVALKRVIVKEFKEVKLIEAEISGQLQLEGSDMSGADIPPAYDREEVEEREENMKKWEIERDLNNEKEKGNDLETKCELTVKQKVYVVMVHFNIKLAPVLHVVTKDGPLLIDFLRSLDAKIVEATAASMDPSSARPTEGSIDENRVRLTQLEFQFQELIDMVNTFVHKLRLVIS